MFNWNDEELANIIWGAADKSDDHIVPYNEASDDYCNKKEWKHESHTIKPTEQKTHRSKIDLQDRKLENSSNFDKSEGISTSDLEWTRKEQGDLVDYGWANIGSFDDLDQIFSNDDTIFGNISLGNAEVLRSSRDATNSPIKVFLVSSDSWSFTSGAVTNASEHLEIKSDYIQKDD
ncbi:hypothetical protein ACFX12_027996 [Malus domestica]